MKLESGAGILQVANDGFLDAGAELGAHLGRSVHVNFETIEGINQRDGAWGTTRESELDTVPEDTLWMATLSGAWGKLKAIGTPGRKQ